MPLCDEPILGLVSNMILSVSGFCDKLYVTGILFSAQFPLVFVRFTSLWPTVAVDKVLVKLALQESPKEEDNL